MFEWANGFVYMKGEWGKRGNIAVYFINLMVELYPIRWNIAADLDKLPLLLHPRLPLLPPAFSLYPQWFSHCLQRCPAHRIEPVQLTTFAFRLGSSTTRAQAPFLSLTRFESKRVESGRVRRSPGERRAEPGAGAPGRGQGAAGPGDRTHRSVPEWFACKYDLNSHRSWSSGWEGAHWRLLFSRVGPEWNSVRSGRRLLRFDRNLTAGWRDVAAEAAVTRGAAVLARLPPGWMDGRNDSSEPCDLIWKLRGVGGGGGGGSDA